MSHTRGKDPLNPGKFSYTCYDFDGNIFRQEGNFETYLEADRAAEKAERDMTFGKINSGNVDSEMSVEDLFKELDEIYEILNDK